MLGSAVAFERGDHMRMTAVVNKLQPAARAFLDLLATAAALAFLLLILPYAWEYAVEEAVIHTPALEMRADGAKLNSSLRSELAAKGLTFNDPKLDAFRATLVKSGFYTEWRQKYGEEAWALLEKYTGKLG